VDITTIATVTSGAGAVTEIEVNTNQKSTGEAEAKSAVGALERPKRAEGMIQREGATVLEAGLQDVTAAVPRRRRSVVKENAKHMDHVGQHLTTARRNKMQKTKSSVMRRKNVVREIARHMDHGGQPQTTTKRNEM